MRRLHVRPGRGPHHATPYTETVWYAIWTVLVVAAVAVPALLALGLWRRVRAIGADFSATADRVSAAFGDEPEPPAHAVPTLFAVGTTTRAHALRAMNHALRDRRRHATVQRAAARWARLGLVGRVPDPLIHVPQQ